MRPGRVSRTALPARICRERAAAMSQPQCCVTGLRATAAPPLLRGAAASVAVSSGQGSVYPEGWVLYGVPRAPPCGRTIATAAAIAGRCVIAIVTRENSNLPRGPRPPSHD